MSTLRKRLASVEDRIELQQHRELQRQFKGRPDGEASFFIVHGYWPDFRNRITTVRLDATLMLGPSTMVTSLATASS